MLRIHVRSSVAILLVTASSTTALAGAPDGAFFDPPQTGPTSNPSPERTTVPVYSGRTDKALPSEKASEWYGDQILYVDGALVLLALPTLGVTLIGYPLGGPIVHLAYENYGRAAGSLALRVGVPMVGVIATAAVACRRPPSDPQYPYDDGDSGMCAVMAVVIGAPLGAMVATAIDSAVLAWADEPEPEPLRDTSETGLRITPTFAPTVGGASVGVVGVF